MIRIPESGRVRCLDAMLSDLDVWYHLYVVEVDTEDVESSGDLVEATFPGYAPVQVKTWSPAVMVDIHAASTADPVQWQRGSGGVDQDVYGYFTTDGVSGPLLWVERVCGRESIPMRLAGQLCVVWPRITDRPEPGEECVQIGGVLVGWTP